MEFINVNETNIDREHICCAIVDKKGENCVSSKKAWLKHCFEDGLIFKKLNERGKVFIEYIPAEKAWCPIIANNYMHINCLWVSGKFKGQGYSNKLLEMCINDAKEKGKSGLTVISSKKKRSFLSDPKYFKHKGFKVADTAKPDFELLYLPFEEGSNVPKFKDSSRENTINEKGMVLYYSNQCPFTEKYAPIIKDIAEKNEYTLKLIKFETKEQAQNAPTPVTTYSFFYNGEFITNEIFSEKKFEEFLAQIANE